MLQCFGLKLAARLLGTTKQNREDRLSSKCFLKISVILVVSSVPESHPINKVHRTLPESMHALAGLYVLSPSFGSYTDATSSQCPEAS